MANKVYRILANQDRVKAIYCAVVVVLLMLCVFLLLMIFRSKPTEIDNSFDLVTPLIVNTDETATPRNDYDGELMQITASGLLLGDVLRDSNSNHCSISKIAPQNGKILIVCGKETHLVDQNRSLVVRRKGKQQST